MNFIIFVLSKSIIKLIAANHLIIRERTKLDIGHKSLKVLLEMITLVSSAFNNDSETKYSKLIVTQQQWMTCVFIYSDKLLNGGRLKQNLKYITTQKETSPVPMQQTSYLKLQVDPSDKAFSWVQNTYRKKQIRYKQ
jgi:hypothetical protein